MNDLPTIYTIGHSTHPLDEFISMLTSFGIECVVDIRSYPGSKRYPHFNKEELSQSLQERNILYIHLKDLGGRRKPNADSLNTAWRNEVFRGYADYMETKDFQKAIEELQQIARAKKVAYMCSEAVWWRCHRALVSDYLKNHNWNVIHIMGLNKSEEHPYTSAAHFEDDRLTYHLPGALFGDKTE